VALNLMHINAKLVANYCNKLLGDFFLICNFGFWGLAMLYVEAVPTYSELILKKVTAIYSERWNSFNVRRS
jgi:hypothetical protein